MAKMPITAKLIINPSGVQSRGKGSDSEIAKNNAINITAKETAKKLVALINSKGIN